MTDSSKEPFRLGVKSTRRKVLGAGEHQNGYFPAATAASYGYSEDEVESEFWDEKELVIPLQETSSGSTTVTSRLGVAGRTGPMLKGTTPAELLSNLNDEQRFIMDISSRATDIAPTSSAYKTVPVERFGAALLRGMGWSASVEEEKVLKDTTTEKPLVAREPRLGLGAASRPSEKNGGKPNSGEKAPVAPREPLPSRQLAVGNIVRLMDPRFENIRAVVVQTASVPGLDQVRVQLESDGAAHDVSKSDIIRLGEEELHAEPYTGAVPSLTPMSGLSLEPEKRSSGISDSSSRKRKHRDSAAEVSGERAEAKKPRAEPHLVWLRTGIQVRVVSKKACGTGAYLQKADVMDVHINGADVLASIRMLHGEESSGNLVENVKQSKLETVLPPIGMPCIVLMGEYKGQMARLLEKRKGAGQVVVELDEYREAVLLSMDAVAATSSR